MDEEKKLEETVFALVMQAVPSSIDKATITAEMSLRRDLGLDSLGMASFLFRCGEELGIDPNDLIEVIAVERLHTVGDVVAMGARIMGGAAQGGVGQTR